MRTTIIIYTYNHELGERITQDLEEFFNIYTLTDIQGLDLVISLDVTEAYPHHIVFIDEDHPLLEYIKLYESSKEKNVTMVLLKEKAEYFLNKGENLPHDYSKGELIQLVDKIISKRINNSRLIYTHEFINPVPRRLYYATSTRETIYHDILDQAKLKKPLLIKGDKGTGKSTLAYMAAYQHYKQHYPIITIDCKSIKSESLEQWFFGVDHKLGIISKFPNASFIIENIEESSEAFQSKIKFLLDNLSYTKVGGEILHTSNVYILFTTSQDIERYGRCIPTLRQRIMPYQITLPNNDMTQQDVLPIFNGLLSEIGKEYGYEELFLTQEVIDTIRYYEFVDNIRGLEETIRYTVSHLQGKTTIELNDLPLEVTTNKNMIRNLTSKSYSLRNILEQNIYNIRGIEKQIIQGCIKKNKYMLGLTARELGMTPQELKERIKFHRISLKKLKAEELS